jgi:hypothetical protein
MNEKDSTPNCPPTEDQLRNLAEQETIAGFGDFEGKTSFENLDSSVAALGQFANAVAAACDNAHPLRPSKGN